MCLLSRFTQEQADEHFALCLTVEDLTDWFSYTHLVIITNQGFNFFGDSYRNQAWPREW